MIEEIQKDGVSIEAPKTAGFALPSNINVTYFMIDLFRSTDVNDVWWLKGVKRQIEQKLDDLMKEAKTVRHTIARRVSWYVSIYSYYDGYYSNAEKLFDEMLTLLHFSDPEKKEFLRALQQAHFENYRINSGTKHKQPLLFKSLGDVTLTKDDYKQIAIKAMKNLLDKMVTNPDWSSDLVSAFVQVLNYKIDGDELIPNSVFQDENIQKNVELAIKMSVEKGWINTLMKNEKIARLIPNIETLVLDMFTQAISEQKWEVALQVYTRNYMYMNSDSISTDEIQASIVKELGKAVSDTNNVTDKEILKAISQLVTNKTEQQQLFTRLMETAAKHKDAIVHIGQIVHSVTNSKTKHHPKVSLSPQALSAITQDIENTPHDWMEHLIDKGKIGYILLTINVLDANSDEHKKMLSAIAEKLHGIKLTKYIKETGALLNILRIIQGLQENGTEDSSNSIKQIAIDIILILLNQEEVAEAEEFAKQLHISTELIADPERKQQLKKTIIATRKGANTIPKRRAELLDNLKFLEKMLGLGKDYLKNDQDAQKIAIEIIEETIKAGPGKVLTLNKYTDAVSSAGLTLPPELGQYATELILDGYELVRERKADDAYTITMRDFVLLATHFDIDYEMLKRNNLADKIYSLLQNYGDYNLVLFKCWKSGDITKKSIDTIFNFLRKIDFDTKFANTPEFAKEAFHALLKLQILQQMLLNQRAKNATNKPKQEIAELIKYFRQKYTEFVNGR